MAHIAIIITGLKGKLNASFEIVRRLQNEGHRLTYICPQDISLQVESQGFKFVKVPEVNYNYENPDSNAKGKSWPQRFQYHFKNRGSHFQTGKELLHLEEYKKILTEVNPDRVLADMEMHDLIFTSVALRIPITLFTTWFSDKISSHLPPIRTTILPGVGFRGSRLGIIGARAYLRLRFQLKVVLDHLTFRHYRRFVLKEYAKEIGFDMRGLLPNNFPPIFSYTKLPIVTMAIKELDFPHVQASNFNYAGAMVFAERDEKVEDIAVIEAINGIIRNKEKQGQKLIYCSVSTFVKADVSFLKNVVKAFENELNWILVLSLGGKLAIEELGSFANNVHVFKYVPQLKVLQYADCSINHGGINSINECIHFKVPMLVYSGKNFDQNGCAARVAYHELGLMGNKDIDTAKDINQNITNLLTNAEFKENVINFNDIHLKYREGEISSLIFV